MQKRLTYILLNGLQQQQQQQQYEAMAGRVLLVVIKHE